MERALNQPVGKDIYGIPGITTPKAQHLPRLPPGTFKPSIFRTQPPLPLGLRAAAQKDLKILNKNRAYVSIYVTLMYSCYRVYIHIM
jgi:hypothetical protein